MKVKFDYEYEDSKIDVGLKVEGEYDEDSDDFTCEAITIERIEKTLCNVPLDKDTVTKLGGEFEGDFRGLANQEYADEVERQDEDEEEEEEEEEDLDD